MPPPTATPIGYREGWTLTWQDEFDGPAIDEAKWTHEIGGHGWGNAEDEFYTAEPDNSFIENGRLVIQALEQRKQGKPYTSARLITKDKFAQAYGRFEARIQIPRGQGIWPAFWLLGEDISTAGWPDSGEIDIMENIGREPGIVHGTVHGPGYSGANGVGASYSLPDNAPFADDFHVYAIEWEPEAIRWYVDDVLYNTITPDDVAGEWVYNHPFFILLNLAVGGNWPGYPDETTEFPQRLTVDYVRVYARP
ncbi:MAG: glycoside hydrolase family 16 protein [Ardenticatenaceae bacterium]|nr:glycoside hydrolase family 16 protein [Ardenticatenaceae bacterium]